MQVLTKTDRRNKSKDIILIVRHVYYTLLISVRFYYIWKIFVFLYFFCKKRTMSSHNTQSYRTRNTEHMNCTVTYNQSIILQTYTLLLQIYIAVEKMQRSVPYIYIYIQLKNYYLGPCRRILARWNCWRPFITRLTATA